MPRHSIGTFHTLNVTINAFNISPHAFARQLTPSSSPSIFSFASSTNLKTHSLPKPKQKAFQSPEMASNIGDTFLLVIIMMGALSSLSSGTVQSECSSSLGLVSSCITYVTGGTPTVSSQCCSATSKLYSTKEVCLCYLVEQAYTNTSAAAVGAINMQKLLGLPSSCNIKTANATKCIALLGLTPSSPGAAVFLSPPSSTPSSPTTTTSPPPPAKSAAFIHQALSTDKLTLLAVAVLLCVFPVGFMAQTM